MVEDEREHTGAQDVEENAGRGGEKYRRCREHPCYFLIQKVGGDCLAGVRFVIVQQKTSNKDPITK